MIFLIFLNSCYRIITKNIVGIFFFRKRKKKIVNCHQAETVTLRDYHSKVTFSIPLENTEVSELSCLVDASVLAVFRINRGARKVFRTPDYHKKEKIVQNVINIVHIETEKTENI